MTVSVPLVLFLAISVAFWYAGKRNRERDEADLAAGVPSAMPIG